MLDYKYSPFQIAHECCTELINAQPPKDRISYKHLLLQDLNLESANEAFGNKPPVQGAGRSKLVEVLYKDIMSKSNVDFGTIPQSRGDITRVQYYKTMQQSIDSLNQLLGERANDDMIRMNELHEAIIAERQAFEFGYKANVELIQYIYCTLVEALMDVITENIVMYVDYLKETQNIDLPPQVKNTNNSRVDKSVDTFLSVRKKGEWKKLIDYYRREYSKRFFAEAMIIGAVSIVGIAGLLWAIRSLIYTYFYSVAKVDDKAKAMNQYLVAVSSAETDPKALRKQQKASTKLTNVSAFIETKILKEDPQVTREIQKSDAAISKAALMGVNQVPAATTVSSGGSDYEFDL
jgi:hypothetical protein